MDTKCIISFESHVDLELIRLFMTAKLIKFTITFFLSISANPTCHRIKIPMTKDALCMIDVKLELFVCNKIKTKQYGCVSHLPNYKTTRCLNGILLNSTSGTFIKFHHHIGHQQNSCLINDLKC